MIRAYLKLPVEFFSWLGAPFRFENKSNTESEYFLQQEYIKQRDAHWENRIPVAFVVATLIAINIGFGIFLPMMFLVVPVLWFIFFIIIGAGDLILLFARSIFYVNAKKEAEEAGTSLVVANFYKDTSWETVKKNWEAERAEAHARKQARINEWNNNKNQD